MYWWWNFGFYRIILASSCHSVIVTGMNINDIRSKYEEYFQKKGHAVLPSAPIIPQNDATTLFTGSGMQPLIPYLLGQDHPKGNRLVNSQKCFRAEDIEEIGDNRHTTFFEMLGNWSLGDYWKKEQLGWYFDFLTNHVGINPHNLYVTCYIGNKDNNIPRDTESAEIWKELFSTKNITANDIEIGSEQDGYKKGMQNGRIFYYDDSKNWWSRAGSPDKMPAGEPGGPDSEVFYDFGTPHDKSFGLNCHVNCDCGRFVELGNSVFMSYLKNQDGSFSPLPKKNVDHGSGLSRIVSAVNNDPDVFKTEPLSSVINAIQNYATPNKKTLYGKSIEFDRYYRIIADHLQGAVMMIADNIVPGNTDQGYILRRLIRRAIRFARYFELSAVHLSEVSSILINFYQDKYPEVSMQTSEVIKNEGIAFEKTLSRGLREFSRGERDAFILFTTYGFPIELTQELAAEQGENIDMIQFHKKIKEHQETSRSGAEGKFKGGLADKSDAVIKLHTAHHLLLAALQQTLDQNIKQRGSNITNERMRMDFSFDRKLTDDEKIRIENLVNEWIRDGFIINKKVIPREEAEKIGAEQEFGTKYPDMVTVYFIQKKDGSYISKEFCGGPHVKDSSDMGHFVIKKESASSHGIRRIKAILE